MTDHQEPAAGYVDLPAAVEGDFEVYVNGILQQNETDYRVDGRTLVFPRPLVPEVKMTKLQILRAALGIAGTYNKYDSIDIAYEHNGRKLVATGLQPRTPGQAPAR